ncbi:MAG: hypothetical protein DIZ80_16610 [endosymbiont of Galathealinum brachiosum]|uniref:Kazal-like domain-containing protein n=1 Tax=endosymbiont of Galathealinum brachiosum TaxID=2200906 RepID=A0A370D8F5_9GAMM|nr:MAG: hypothetical protein DIZ80_16610 [endosymbiont of Galathealinum brachiosum]
MIKFRQINNNVLSAILMVFVSVTSLSCAMSPEKDVVDKKLTQCESPRSQVCTRDYTPVCGFESDGNHKTFSNACTACSNENVISYDEGACK